MANQSIRISASSFPGPFPRPWERGCVLCVLFRRARNYRWDGAFNLNTSFPGPFPYPGVGKRPWERECNLNRFGRRHAEKHYGSSLSSWLMVDILLVRVSLFFTPFVPICSQFAIWENSLTKLTHFSGFCANDVIIKRVPIAPQVSIEALKYP